MVDLNKIGSLAISLMSQYGLIKRGWNVQYVTKPGIYASCDHINKVIKLSRIALPYLKEDSIKDQILHEIAHALLPRSVGHGREWKKLFQKIGGTGEITPDLSNVIAKDSYYKYLSKYTYICDNCHIKYAIEKKPGLKYCKRCSPNGFNSDFLMRYVVNY